MTVGERIKMKREELGISQTDLATKINSSKQTVYKYENGLISNIPYDKIIAIAKALHVSPEWIMGWKNKAHVTIAKELNLSEEAISKLEQLPRIVERTSGYSASDILNAFILNDKFIQILKKILLIYTRTDEGWKDALRFISTDDNSLQLDIEQVKAVDRTLVTNLFASLYDDVIDSEIMSFNMIEHKNGCVTLSIRPENQFLYGLNSKSQVMVSAAHEREDIEVTDEMQQHDDDIMDDDNF